MAEDASAATEDVPELTDLEVVRMTDELVVRLVASLRQAFRTPDWYNVSNCVVSAMEFVGPMQGLSGAQKKVVVVQGITQFVDETDMMGDLEPFVLRALPVVIENIISADRHRLRLNPKIEGLAVRLGKKLRCCG